MKKDELDVALFEARLDDAFRRAENYEVFVGDFLSPREQMLAERFARARKSTASLCFFGGFEGSERNRFFLLPEYLDAPEGADPRGFVPEETEEAVVCLEIVGSGYRTLSHRDYLGSLLSFGIDRGKMGDIVVTHESRALVFCDGKIADYILSEPRRMGNDAVKIKLFDVPPDFKAVHEFAPVSDTVASARLDGVVAALCNLSREKAHSLITSENVELNYEPETRVDRTLQNGDVVSVRGFGKYIIRSVTEPTKKGRLRLLADKYV